MGSAEAELGLGLAAVVMAKAKEVEMSLSCHHSFSSGSGHARCCRQGECSRAGCTETVTHPSSAPDNSARW
jgi:hypothetical protein